MFRREIGGPDSRKIGGEKIRLFPFSPMLPPLPFQVRIQLLKKFPTFVSANVPRGSPDLGLLVIEDFLFVRKPASHCGREVLMVLFGDLTTWPIAHIVAGNGQRVGFQQNV